jgi:hypothetical protein
MSVADGGDNRRRDQWPYAFHGGNALAVRCVLECDLNPTVSSGDLLVQLCQLFIEALKQLPAKARQLVLGISSSTAGKPLRTCPGCCGNTIPYSASAHGPG